MSELLSDRPGWTLRRCFVSEMNNAVYLLTSKPHGTQILIDAAAEPDTLRELLAADGDHTALRVIATTHAHWDHTRATAELAAETGAEVAIGAADAAQLTAERGLTPDRLLEHGEVITVDNLRLETVALRGHTPGSMAFVLREAGEPTVIFTGDSLFPGGVGNTDRDPERFASLMRDVRERLFDVFDDDTVIYPGHGDATTLGAERPALPEWQARGW